MNEPAVTHSPVLVIDALGFTEQIKAAGDRGLVRLASGLERQFYLFRAKVPRRMAFLGRSRVFGTREFATLQLNDMFILHASRRMKEAQLRFLISGSMLFQSMLLAGLVPRGGLGFGPIYRSRGMLIGNGFVDAYETSEKRDECSRHVCAIQLSSSFLHQMPNSRRAFQLLCFFEGKLYIHPWGLVDPEMGEFSADRIQSLLTKAGANKTKIDASRRFFEGLENYETAMMPGSATRQMLEAEGAPWTPQIKESIESLPEK